MTNKNIKESVFLIDDISLNIKGIASGWDYDNRTESNNGAFSNVLKGTSDGFGIRLKRDFYPQSEVKLTLETIINLQTSINGIYFSFTDNDGNEYFRISTENDKFVFISKHSKAVSEVSPNFGDNRIKIHFDMNENDGFLLLGGTKILNFEISSDIKEISRLYIGTDGKNVITAIPQNLVFYRNYLVYECFQVTDLQKLPCDWKTNSKNISIKNMICTGENDNYSAYINGIKGSINETQNDFDECFEKTVFESYILLPKCESGAYVSLNLGEKPAIVVKTKDNEFVLNSGKILRKYTDNVWQVIRIEADPKTKTAFLRIDGKEVGTFKFENDINSFDNIKIGFNPENNAEMWFDDIDVRPIYDFDDYCPKPNPALPKDYHIGMNICSLWRNGHHFGWDFVSPFSDIESVLGFYDEGLTELADWEIKFFVEHGVECQHLCWYCPSPDIKAPIKKTRMNEALHDGFFNAKYSNLMKFTLMWENTGINVHSLEQFKEYIWKYWCEYYFSDPRYWVLDNKPLITAWSYKRVLEAFGGFEGVQEAFKFMREDIKRYGFDGIIFLYADGHNMTKPVFEEMAQTGADGAYGYHWNKGGCSFEHQKYRMTTQQDFNVYHIVPTAGVGFNNVGWAGTRSPLISQDEHKQILSYIKDTFLPKYENSWKSRTLLISTWNEYGEGHFVMPTLEKKFMYLDDIREKYVPEVGVCDNVVPSKEQKARLSYLYPATRTPIRKLGYEAAPLSEIPNKTVRLWNFKNKEAEIDWCPCGGLSDFKFENGILCAETVGIQGEVLFANEIDMNAKEFSHIKVRMKNKNKLNFRIAFVTADDTVWNGQKLVYHDIATEDGFHDYYLDMSSLETWKGIIRKVRIDVMINGKFEIEEIEFCKCDNNAKTIVLEIDGITMDFDFTPYYKNDDLYVTMNPEKQIFGRLKAYHEYNRFTGRLMIATKNKTLEITVGKDTVLVCGKSEKLENKVALHDGLPTLPINLIAKYLGYTVNKDGFTTRISTI